MQGGGGGDEAGGIAPGAGQRRQFQAMGPAAIRGLCKPDGVLFDVKSALPYGTADGRL